MYHLCLEQVLKLFVPDTSWTTSTTIGKIMRLVPSPHGTSSTLLYQILLEIFPYPCGTRFTTFVADSSGTIEKVLRPLNKLFVFFSYFLISYDWNESYCLSLVRTISDQKCHITTVRSNMSHSLWKQFYIGMQWKIRWGTWILLLSINTLRVPTSIKP